MLDHATHASVDLVEIVQRMLGDDDAGWNIGTFGAIAEFHHVAGDPLPTPVMSPTGGEVLTTRGGIRVDLSSDAHLVAYEGLSKRREAWTHGLAFCLPAEGARMHGRTVLTDLGVDTEALREEDRSGVLFDLGVGAPQVDFCVRAQDPALIEVLRASCGRSVFDPTNPAMSAIKAEHPHRICLSRLGRVEVFQPLGSTSKGIPSPTGPHTHVLPGLLKLGRTHSANTPIPNGSLPALSLHPGNPVTDRLGKPRDFSRSAFDAFEELLGAFGPPGYSAEKQRVRDAVAAGGDPRSFAPADSRDHRRGARIALRQMLHVDCDVAGLSEWLDMLDRSQDACDPDDHANEGHA